MLCRHHAREHDERLIAFAAEHKIHPIVDEMFAFNEAQLAYERLRAAGHFGKIAITFDR